MQVRYDYYRVSQPHYVPLIFGKKLPMRVYKKKLARNDNRQRWERVSGGCFLLPQSLLLDGTRTHIAPLSNRRGSQILSLRPERDPRLVCLAPQPRRATAQPTNGTCKSETECVYWWVCSYPFFSIPRATHSRGHTAYSIQIPLWRILSLRLFSLTADYCSTRRLTH